MILSDLQATVFFVVLLSIFFALQVDMGRQRSHYLSLIAFGLVCWASALFSALKGRIYGPHYEIAMEIQTERFWCLETVVLSCGLYWIALGLIGLRRKRI